MKQSETTRNYNCKDEELPVVCRYALSCIRRDLVDFAAFSPVFNEDYLNRFQAKINLVDELVSPKIETDELKKITKRLYLTMDNLLDPIAKIRGYLRLAKESVPVSAKDFGLTLLSRKIASRDAEGVRQNLLIVNTYIEKYREPLVAIGLNEAIIEQFNAAVTSITNDNQLQFEIVSKRKTTVQNNLKALNELYGQLIDLLNVGRSLYKNTDPLKAKEYVFNALKKNVRTN
jgi:hypothetical protein